MPPRFLKDVFVIWITSGQEVQLDLNRTSFGRTSRWSELIGRRFVTSETAVVEKSGQNSTAAARFLFPNSAGWIWWSRIGWSRWTDRFQTGRRREDEQFTNILPFIAIRTGWPLLNRLIRRNCQTASLCGRWSRRGQGNDGSSCGKSNNPIKRPVSLSVSNDMVLDYFSRLDVLILWFQTQLQAKNCQG